MILDALAESARKRVAEAAKWRSLEEIRRQALSLPPKAAPFAFERVLRGKRLSFICEVKKASPSKGVIAPDFPYLAIAQEYERAGASAISVLTEPEYFKGRDSYLTEIRQAVSLPLLRKDFTVHEYQLYEARLMGADAVLLIAALLDTDTLRRYIGICNRLGLSALVEAHDAQEVHSALAAGARVVGVNNRDLRTFEVDVKNSIRLRELAPSDTVFVSESGIKTSKDIKRLYENHVDAVLIGETLMRSQDKKKMLEELNGGALAK